MIHKSNAFILFILITILGCIFPQTRNTRNSADYSDFIPINDTTMVYLNPDHKVKDYNEFFVAPVEVYANPQRKISPKDRGIFTEWSGKLRKKIIAGFEKDYKLAEKPGKGVLKIKVEVVDIKPFMWLRKPDGTRYFRTDTVLKGTKFDVSCLDGATKETIFASVTLFGGEKYIAYKDLSLLPNVEEVFDQWLKFLRFMLEKSREDLVPAQSNAPSSLTLPKK